MANARKSYSAIQVLMECTDRWTNMLTYRQDFQNKIFVLTGSKDIIYIKISVLIHLHEHFILSALCIQGGKIQRLQVLRISPPPNFSDVFCVQRFLIQVNKSCNCM
jgi:hypothetical protein